MVFFLQNSPEKLFLQPPPPRGLAASVLKLDMRQGSPASFGALGVWATPVEKLDMRQGSLAHEKTPVHGGGELCVGLFV